MNCAKFLRKVGVVPSKAGAFSAEELIGLIAKLEQGEVLSEENFPRAYGLREKVRQLKSRGYKDLPF